MNRLEIAAHIMAEYAANPESWQEDNHEDRATRALKDADALIAAHGESPAARLAAIAEALDAESASGILAARIARDAESLADAPDPMGKCAPFYDALIGIKPGTRVAIRSDAPNPLRTGTIVEPYRSGWAIAIDGGGVIVCHPHELELLGISLGDPKDVILPEDLATRIAEDLMTCGDGEKAHRLLLENEKRVPIAGWSRAALITQISKHLTP
jgi:hypothetical protein